MRSNKVLNFLKSLFYNQRINWYKANFKLLSHCEKIIDIGCGKGLFLELAPDRIVGIDHNHYSLRECIDKGYTVIRGDALNLPFTKESFDGIHCADVIEHFCPKDAICLLSEISRVLKTGGVAVIATPLSSKIFWNEVSHVRPYPPIALISYCVTDVYKGNGTQQTYEPLPYKM